MTMLSYDVDWDADGSPYTMSIRVHLNTDSERRNHDPRL